MNIFSTLMVHVLRPPQMNSPENFGTAPLIYMLARFHYRQRNVSGRTGIANSVISAVSYFPYVA